MTTGFLAELARAVVEAARVRPGERAGGSPPNATGGTLVRPGGRDCYPAFWIRDFALSLESGLLTAEEQRHALLLTARTQPSEPRILPSGSLIPRGAIADHINFDGTPIFFPGTYDALTQGGPWGRLPPFDDQFFFVEMAWQYVRQTEDRAILRICIDGLTLLERLELAFAVPPADAETQLVCCTEQDRGVSFGFTDVVVHTGHLLFASLLRLRAAERLAELTAKPAYTETAAAMRRALPAAFAGPGGLLRASTGTGAQPDVWGSAFAVSTGAVSGMARDAICRALARALQAGTLAWRGNVRHVPTAYDASAESAWERLVLPTPLNRYQNGAYWGTPTGWVCEAVAQPDEPAARGLAADYLADLHRSDFRKGPEFGGPYECLHPLGDYRQNPVYMTSVTCPLAALRRLGWVD